jgi:hypothetical protein
MNSSDTTFIYQAKVGAFGEVTFWKNPKTSTYSFTFFNGVEYAPLHLSEDAAYYVWAFLGCEHPDAITSNTLSSTIGNKPRPSKKAGLGKANKKRPSLAKKKK